MSDWFFTYERPPVMTDFATEEDIAANNHLGVNGLWVEIDVCYQDEPVAAVEAAVTIDFNNNLKWELRHDRNKDLATPKWWRKKHA